MTVTFFSNFLNHHQLPFCLEMYKILGDDFNFVATSKIGIEQLSLGYSDMSGKYPFLLDVNINENNFQKALSLGYESDVVIIGSANEVFIKKRLKQNKLTFRYCERIFKKRKLKYLNPKSLYTIFSKHIKYRNKKLYILCAGAYVQKDFAFIKAYRNKMLKWGYFPENKIFNVKKLMDKKKNLVPKLLWVGRFIDWKHPELAIELARLLHENNYHFELSLIGRGDMEDNLLMLIRKYKLENRVKILGSMSAEKVRAHMECANIVVSTSDYKEGWGAVLNEAMNSGCSIVVSDAIGSVPFLVKHKKNGMIFKSQEIMSLYKCVTALLNDNELQKTIGSNAYNTIDKLWNAKVVAKRFAKLAEEGLNDFRFLYKEGPLSKI